MSTGTTELAPPDEGGDDRRPEVLAQKRAEVTQHLSELLATPYPGLDEIELERMLKEAAAQPAEIESASETTEQIVKGARAIYGFEPALGNAVLAARVQSNGFAPAGLYGRPDDRTNRLMGRPSRPRRTFPGINGLF